MTTEDKLDAILSRLARIERELARVTTPVSQVTVDQVMERLPSLGRSAVDKLLRRAFSDARPLGQRRPGVTRLAFSDEVDVYIREGLAGLRRFRREAGRG